MFASDNRIKFVFRVTKDFAGLAFIEYCGIFRLGKYPGLAGKRVHSLTRRFDVQGVLCSLCRAAEMESATGHRHKVQAIESF